MTTHYYLPNGERANEWKDILYVQTHSSMPIRNTPDETKGLYHYFYE